MNARVVHPGIADPAPGAIRNGSSPMFQYAEAFPVWNHGEGFAVGGGADFGGWFTDDNGSNVTIAEVHSPSGWVPASWPEPFEPASSNPVEHMVGYMRPSDPATVTLPANHPLYGALGQVYVDTGAFELFRPVAPYNPNQHEKVVVIIYNWQTLGFPLDANGDRHNWYQVYQGFFSPDGLIRDEAAPRSVAAFLGNTGMDADTVLRPALSWQVVRSHDASSNWYPIVGYAVPSVTRRQTTLNEQRNMQLRSAVLALLQDNSPLNPLGASERLTPTGETGSIESEVVVVFSGGSNGGHQTMWSLMRYPELIHGSFSSVINPSIQRLFGEHDLGFAVGMLSGAPQQGATVQEVDFLHWGQYTWNQGFWIHDISYTRRFALQETFRPACFIVGDEDITSTGTDWTGLANGGAWSPVGERSMSGAAPWTIGSKIAWSVSETACHGTISLFPNPYVTGQPETLNLGEINRGLIDRVITHRIAEQTAATTQVITAPPTRIRTSELRGLDDPHEWALGRKGEAMPDHSSDPVLRRDDDWFDTVQPGAAGTFLGQKEAMRIYDHKVYVVGAEGVVSSFEVDQTMPSKLPLKKVAHSNDGTTTASGVVLPVSLGHDAAGMTFVTSGGSTDLVVATRRHLHRLDPATLNILQTSAEIPWESARPHHLKTGDVLPGLPTQLIFASVHGGLVFYDTNLSPIYEWPEPGIKDFVIQGNKVTILSTRGVVADVTFEVSAGPSMFTAKLHAASKPLPSNFETEATQGDPHDLELFTADWSAIGRGVVTAPVALWTGDIDGTAVRGYLPPTRVGNLFRTVDPPFIPGLGRLDMATCKQGATSGGGSSDIIGDHLLVLERDNLSLYDQFANLLGQRALFVGGLNLGFIPFGYQAHALVVGDLGVTGPGQYEEQVVVATQSGALMWMHIDEIVGPPGPMDPTFLPVGNNANPAATQTAIQPRTNQSMSATWAIAERDNGNDQLHLLDHRGGYWRVDPTGLVTFWDSDIAMAGSRGWDDLGNLDSNGDPVTITTAYVLEELAIEQQFGGSQRITSKPWAPMEVIPLAHESSQHPSLAGNWVRSESGAYAFEGFLAYRWGGTLFDVSHNPLNLPVSRDAYFWSSAGTNANGDSFTWGNMVEGVRFPSPSGPWDVTGLWASSAYAMGSLPQSYLSFHPLRSYVPFIPIMTQQAASLAQLPGMDPVLVLGCPGGRVRVVEPGMGSAGSGHSLGSLSSETADHGFGGCALATKVIGSKVRIWFGTLYGGAPNPAAYGQAAGSLSESEVATGGVHVMDWTPGAGGFLPQVSMSLTPSATDRGGYGVVGLCVGDLLPEQGPPEDELVVCTLAGDVIVLDADTLAERWRTHVPGAAGFYNSARIADLDSDGKRELYVAGSFGMWRFNQP